MKLELWGDWKHVKSLTLTGSTEELDIAIEDVRFDDRYSVDITVTSDLDVARVEGRVSIGAELVCSRCATAFRMTIAGDFDLVARHLKLGEVSPQALEDEDVPLDEADMVFIPYGENAIDITGHVRDVLLLEVPVKPLHSELCKGLCAVCGADLNQETCECGVEQPDGRWGGLEKLK